MTLYASLAASSLVFQASWGREREPRGSAWGRRLCCRLDLREHHSDQGCCCAGWVCGCGDPLRLMTLIGLPPCPTPPWALPHVQVAKAVTLVVGGVRAARLLQERLLACVVRLPMGFFDSQPTGRLLNRFTKDVGESGPEGPRG